MIPDGGFSVIKDASFHLNHSGFADTRAVPLAWVPISPRRASARLEVIIVNPTFIAAYASKLDEIGAHLMMTFKARLIMFPQESNGLLWVRGALTMTVW